MTTKIIARNHYITGALMLAALTAPATSLFGQTDLGPVTVGAGLQTSFAHSKTDGSPSVDSFSLVSARLYVNGPVTKGINFMFNTEYDGSKIGVLDAVAQISISPHVNFWAGRFLPPSDRANLYGPYYSNQWGPYNDGIQDGYPFAYVGRDNGFMWWGDFKKVKVSAGAFDGRTTTGARTLLGAARVQVDFWDKEDGYYLNGTYYGDKNLLAIGGATQFQSGNVAATGDFLMERKVKGGGAVSIESEFSYYDGLGGYDGAYHRSTGAYILGAYLFGQPVGPGKFQVLGKFAKADFELGKTADYSQKTSEVQFNYVIKQFKARVMSFYRNQSFDRVRRDNWTAGLGLQVQM